ncbi:hypothetical protein DB346_18255 [Verrucomicrobia bacterium LW23]|nr:hypothetical protein DB346_18255 [Verrucomicrobia bacterium LW23]
MSIVHRFRDEAMATVFEVRVGHADALLARHAADAAFAAAHLVEGLLSRFLETSEVARLGRMRAGEALRMHPLTAECLAVALECAELTGGAFDPAPGRMRAAGAEERATLALDAAGLVVFCDGPAGSRPAGLDLGAIGKGFALDVMARELREWDVEAALLRAGGGSSILAMGAPQSEPDGWRISLSCKQFVLLQGAAISTSGKAVKGDHILDPRTGRPAAGSPARAWALAESAAVSDALSTAWMLLDISEIEEVCERRPGIAAALEWDDSPGSEAPLQVVCGRGGGSGDIGAAFRVGTLKGECDETL